ncbi:MAG: hypothetical protein HC875_17015 [Anaerolineales bacterium]|nr:hypothetical protein [Anaerolineales bacterium]
MNASRITHHASRITLPLLLAALIGAGLFVLVADPARADEPCDNPEEIYLENDFSVESSLPNLYFQAGADYWDMICTSGWCDYSEDFVSISQPVSFQVGATSQLAIKVQAFTGGNGTNFRSRVHFTDDTEAFTGWRRIIAAGEVVFHSFDLSSYAGKSIDKLYIDYQGTYGFSEQYRFFPGESYFYGCPGSPGSSDLCPLVQNAHFAAADGWLLDGTAVISDGVLVLAAGDIAAQNLTLESNKTYNAVISATTGTASLNVVLGAQSEVLDIAEPGLYTATFTMPELAGPVLFSLENSRSAELALDFACVSLATGDGAQPDCLAPENGTFDTAQGWQWYRNAAWEQISQKAALPYNDGSDGDMSLIVAGRAYTMPAVPAGQFLILGYQAQASSEVGLVSSKVGTAETEQTVYKAPFNYEVDITTQAGQTVDIALADSGTSDLLLDNVCIFLSDNPPALPDAADPGGISGMDFGFNYTCSDVPALLAGWGINVHSLQAIYDTGVSVWEPQYYIPWLAAALWSNAGRPISCFLVEQMRLLAGVTQQQINMFLNYVNWVVRSSNLAGPWLQQGVFYLRSAIFSPATAARTTAYGWLNWAVRSARGLAESAGTNWKLTTDWIKEAAVYLSESSFGSGEQLIDNLPGGGTMFGFIDLLWAMATLMWALWSWIWDNVFVLVDIPIRFYYAFNDGVQTEAFSSLMSCSGTNFWCGLLAGTQLVNQTIGHTILYPIVIMLIIMGTLAIFWKHIWQLVHLDIR